MIKKMNLQEKIILESLSQQVANEIRSPLSSLNLILSKVEFSNHEHKEIIQLALKKLDEVPNKILSDFNLKIV